MASLIYHWVVCGKSRDASVAAVNKALGPLLAQQVPALVRGERALTLVWYFADDPTRRLIERLAARDLYKRVYELRLGELGDQVDYAQVKNDLAPGRRVSLAQRLEKSLADTIDKRMRERASRVSVSEQAARGRMEEMAASYLPRVVIDFPTRGVPAEINYPTEVGDAVRKYVAGPVKPRGQRGMAFGPIREMQMNNATVRVYAARELHELIVRYLQPEEVETCVEQIISCLKTEK